MTNMTVSTLVRRVRDEIDEDSDPNNNLWPTRFIIESMNRGMRKVWQRAREAKENWFVRSIVSSDAPFGIYGRQYNPAALKLTANVSEMELPPDFYELLAFEMVVPDPLADPIARFVMRDITHSDFRQLEHELAPDTGGCYVMEVIWREAGPRLLVRPTPQLSEPQNVRLDYIQGPRTLIGRDTFEGSGFNDIMLDAVISYVVLDCYRKQGIADEVNIAGADYSDKLDMVTRAAGPRQVKDTRTVDGFLEDFIA